MFTAFFGNFLKSVFIILILCFVIIALSFGFINNAKTDYISPLASAEKPQISGWVAWWEEKPAYELIKKYPGEIKTVSPVWFMVDEDLELSEIGETEKLVTVTELKNLKIRILPSLGSELSKEKLSILLNDKNKTAKIINDLTAKIKALGADGADIDLESIKKEDKEKFNSFLSQMSESLKKEGLKMSVAVHAQTKKVVWDGVEGQDLETIGKIADEVRIMVYDEHSSGSDPGAISSFEWIKEVAEHNLNLIDKEKIVIGIPTYGYIWTKDSSEGLQFDEFNKYLGAKQYTKSRDKGSGELVIKGKEFTGWLSDSQAMTEKINLLRSLGFNKFILWHLGGMDEKLFAENWQI